MSGTGAGKQVAKTASSNDPFALKGADSTP
jgi:hypothetical protein